MSKVCLNIKVLIRRNPSLFPICVLIKRDAETPPSEQDYNHFNEISYLIWKNIIQQFIAWAANIEVANHILNLN